MRKADLKARIKKIEIVNRVLSDGWSQSIRIILEDIDLTNENLLELKQFMPNEDVVVEITPFQVSLFDQKNAAENLEHSEEPDDEDDVSLSFSEDDEIEDSGKVVKEWSFDAG